MFVNFVNGFRCMLMRANFDFLCLLMGMLFCQAVSAGPMTHSAMSKAKMPVFELFSTGFANGAEIPEIYTCVGENVSPSLSWIGFPADTQSFAIEMIDTDTIVRAGGAYTHWLAWDISVNTTALAVGAGGLVFQGVNSANQIGYSGPCPPKGEKHHYRFTLYALDIRHLPLMRGANHQDFLRAIRDHAQANTTLIGVYQKPSVQQAVITQPLLD